MSGVSPDVLAQWRRDEAAQFRGWDFSYLQGRMVQDKPPWDYVALARERVSRSRALLDQATGDGEVLASLGPFAGFATAIEGYAPNVAIAAERLRPMGVPVVAADEAAPMPFASGAFDLVLNRHGGIQPAHVAEVLGPGGCCLTQQVGGRTLYDLMAHFGAEPKWPNNVLGDVAARFVAAGLEVEIAQEWSGKATFTDVGAVVYYLRAVPWLVDDFSIDRCLPQLAALQERLERLEELAFETSYFLLLAKRR